MVAMIGVFGVLGSTLLLGLNGCGGSGVTPTPDDGVITAPTTTTTTTRGWQPCGPDSGACCDPEKQQICPGNVECQECGGNTCECPNPDSTPPPVPGWEPCGIDSGACCDPTSDSRCPGDIACQFCGAPGCQCPAQPSTSTTAGPSTGPDVDECAAESEQCAGGPFYGGPSCCEDGLDCVQQQLWYSECKMPGAGAAVIA